MPADFQPPVIDGYEPFNLSVLEKLKHSRSIDMRQGPAKIWMEPLGEGRIKIHWDIQSKEQKISQAYIQVYSIRESARGKPNFIQPNYALRLATGLFQGVAIVKIPQNLPVGYKWCLGASLVSAKGWSDKYLYEIPAEMKEEKTTPATPLS
jgi:hypothetical protein